MFFPNSIPTLEQSPVLYGATVLGLSELTLSGIRILNCLESEFIILPLLKFLFSCFLMHFLLTQVCRGKMSFLFCLIYKIYFILF